MRWEEFATSSRQVDRDKKKFEESILKFHIRLKPYKSEFL